MKSLLTLLVCFCLLSPPSIIFCACAVVHQYELPVLPVSLPEPLMPQPHYNNGTDREDNKKHIPRHIWIAVKDKSDELPGHLKGFFDRNSNWEVHICDNKCKDSFINSTFADTGINWAYNAINPLIGAARADIWRYCVLYLHGGLYLDDDSDIKVPLDNIVQPNDRLIMSEEGSSSLGDCYIPTYHLSDASTFIRYPNFSQALHYHGVDEKTNLPIFFHDHTLINWAIFISPRHPVLLRTLHHIVEILRSEYLRKSFIHFARWEPRWKYVMCSTGFVLTYTVRELELENSLPSEYYPRISVNNFKEYKGNVKAIWTGNDPDHYMKRMEKKKVPLLHDYAPVSIEAISDYLEGRSVMGDAGKEIYLIRNRTKCTFGSYELFLKLGFTDRTTKHVPDNILSMIPLGRSVSEDENVSQTISAVISHHPATLTPKTKKKSHSSASNGNSNGNGNTGVSTAASTSTSSLHTYSDTATGNNEITTFLLNATKVLNNITVTCFGDDYAGTRDDYLRNTYKWVIKDTPVMIYPFCARTFQLGNVLGYYFNDLACSDIVGSHFVAVHKEFNILEPDTLVTNGSARYAFFNALPDLVVHPAPLQEGDVKAKMKSECQCLQYCWENNAAPWLRRIPYIRKYLVAAIDAYVSAAGGYGISTVLNNATDYSTVGFEAALPLVPNVTIQYRCGDNVGFGKTRYGLLPFSAYNTDRIPPDIAKYIYIIADSPSRQSYHAYSSRCGQILEKLFIRLKTSFPSAVVVVKRGGDIFLDYARIAFSNVVMCSASTFCLWPAISNKAGQVHFPLTPLVARAATNESAPNLAPNFHWIREVQMIKEFKKYRPWSRLIDDLETL